MFNKPENMVKKSLTKYLSSKPSVAQQNEAQSFLVGDCGGKPHQEASAANETTKNARALSERSRNQNSERIELNNKKSESRERVA